MACLKGSNRQLHTLRDPSLGLVDKYHTYTFLHEHTDCEYFVKLHVPYQMLPWQFTKGINSMKIIIKILHITRYLKYFLFTIYITFYYWNYSFSQWKIISYDTF